MRNTLLYGTRSEEEKYLVNKIESVENKLEQAQDAVARLTKERNRMELKLRSVRAKRL